eukprot:3510962-Prorocentrum_lima.AAC.1
MVVPGREGRGLRKHCILLTASVNSISDGAGPLTIIMSASLINSGCHSFTFSHVCNVHNCVASTML